MADRKKRGSQRKAGKWRMLAAGFLLSAAFCLPASGMVRASAAGQTSLESDSNAESPASPESDSNALLGALQSLPIGPLDGGQALAALLCSKLGPRRAERVSTALSVLTLFPLAALGFWALLRSQYNFTLLAAAGALAFFLFRGERPRGASPV